jgi:hypothetical protein
MDDRLNTDCIQDIWEMTEVTFHRNGGGFKGPRLRECHPQCCKLISENILLKNLVTIFFAEV